MELNLTAKQRQQWQRLTTLMDENLITLAAEVDMTGQVKPAVLEALRQRQLPQTGLADTDRLSQQTLCLLAVTQVSASLATLLATWWQVADAVLTFGTTAQRQTYLDQLKIIGLPALGTTGTPTAAVTALPVTDGWQLTGTVKHVVNAGRAQTYLIVAQTPPNVPSAFLVSANHPGVTTGNPLEPLGLPGLAVADLELDQVKVTATDRLGQIGQGFPIMQRAQAVGRGLLSAVVAGILNHAATQIKQLALGEQPPLVELTPLLATAHAVALSALSVADQIDAHVPFASAAALTGFNASQQGVAQLTAVTGLIGDLAYSRRSPLMALTRDLQTLPLLMGTPADLATAFATSQLNAPAAPVDGAKAIEPEQLAVADLHRVVKKLNLTKDVPVNVGSIATAKRIVALGRGALDPAVLLQAQQLAKWIGAAIAVTQPLTMLEQFSIDQQVGGNAIPVAPEVLINLGISGDDQYLAGITGAQHVLSVNQDATAPIMAASQQVFVGKVADFLDGMVAALN
ncbi:acyl-CoA dehydrogenase [Lactiplantibacillus garii]|uniref:Acyl-CoA dehydrogenase n=1 Tax=Lactiplantibacillus garii TaxID=2306423 RepID=A0A426D654_9LACO|nr:FAD-binding protein [Lactiplantibacillus garii]RRK10136.1 acyl-CoA dehydrogenase [Lactiplantibacillus garii]